MSVTTQNNNYDEAKGALERNVTNAKSSSSMSTISVSDSESMTLNTVTDTPTVGICIDGAVFGLNQGFDFATNNDHSQKCRKYSLCAFNKGLNFVSVNDVSIYCMDLIRVSILVNGNDDSQKCRQY